MTVLDAGLKEQIQQGYRDFLAANGLRPRLGQKQMIAAIANGLAAIEADAESKRVSENPVTVIEAGTGTGKTLAYLLAVLPIARQLGKRVVVATGTVALQEQLVNRDIPSLLRSTDWDYKVALAKGRGRYLCPVRLEQCLDSAAARDSGLFLFEDEMSFNPSGNIIASYRAMDKALQDGGWAGDRDSWPDALDGSDWRPLTVDRRQCSGRRCRLIRECCFFKARDDLEEADCIVANHDLVMADLSLGGGVILPAPEDTLYIFDEGHRIAATALNHFAGSCRVRTTAGWLGRMQKQTESWRPLLGETPELQSRLEKFSAAAADGERLIGLSYPLLEKYLDQLPDGETEQRWCFAGGDPGDELRELAGHLVQSFGVLSTALDVFSDRLGEAMEEPHFPLPRVDLEQLFQQVGIWQGRVEGALHLWQCYAREDDPREGPPYARWLSLEEGAGSPDIRLSASPTDAGGIFRASLWQRCYGAVITSATLRTLGSFDNFSKRCGLPADTAYSAVAGAFDYANAGVIAVPDIGAEGSDSRAHTEALISNLPELINWDEGSLVLFASRRQM
ncbi:MAG: ATP-dependent DNA helicase DinG, partial [Gammaproteobacteria bacterium]